VSQTNAVLFEKRGQLGLITLNRPEAINALNHEMVKAIQATLDAWLSDPDVGVVGLVGNGERGLCAGGDIVSIYQDARHGGRGTVEFWRDEYILDATIARYAKPVVAVMDGIVLGGGIGLAAHASHRIVTQTASVGLPETTIGFVPDVGGTYLLSRAPGELGTHLALTAGSVDAADAIAIGFADHFVLRDRIPGLLEALSQTEATAAIEAAAQAPGPSRLTPHRSWIDEVYASEDLQTIVEALFAEGEAGNWEAQAAAARIARKSPTALSVTLASLRRAAALPSLERVLEQEFRVSVRSLDWPDLAEGIRAQVIDKDRKPKWSPDAIDGVEAEFVTACFEPLPDTELQLKF